jgi:hypothetical protein
MSEEEIKTCIDDDPDLTHITKPCYCAGRKECHECGRTLN